MNKLFTKVATLCVGLAMAAGVGVAVGANQKASSVEAGYEIATSIAVGDTVVFAYSNGETKKELKQISLFGSNYVGEVVDYTDSVPNAVYPLTVEAGTADGSFAFKDADNKYLVWESGNTLNRADAITDNSSWKISDVSGVSLKLTNVKDTNRKLQYNTGNPRFATYGSAQAAFSIFKFVEEGGETYTIKYLPNGGDGKMSPTTSSNPLVGECEFTAPVGKRFASWNTQEDGKGDTYAVGTSVSQNISLYAIWEDIPEYTCAQAIAQIDASGDTKNVYVSGYVTDYEAEVSGGKLSYWMADTADGGKVFEVYLGYGLDGKEFTSKDDLPLGSQIKIYCSLTKYKETYETVSGSKIVSLVAPEKELSSIVISGEMSKVEYYEGDPWNPDGLVVTATFDDQSVQDVSDKVEWSYNPAEAESKEVKSVTVTASYTFKQIKKTDSVEVQVTVSEKPAAKDTYKLDGTKQVIAATRGGVTHYLKENGASNAPLSVATVEEATVFELTLVADDTFEFTVSNDSGKSYLYATAANNGLRFGSGDAIQWKIEDGYQPTEGEARGGAYDIYATDSKGDSRYIALYEASGAFDWRVYKTPDAQNRLENIDLVEVGEPPVEDKYQVSFYEGTTGSSSEYAEGAKVTMPQPTESLIPEGKAFDYWEHKETGNHYAPGEEFTVETSSARFDAVYKDVEPVVTDWTQSQKDAFSAALDGFVPPYFVTPASYEIEGNVVTVDYNELLSQQLNEYLSKEGWTLVQTETSGYAKKDTAHGEIRLTAGGSSTTTHIVYTFVASTPVEDWTSDQKAAFSAALDGFVPPYFGATVSEPTINVNNVMYSVAGDVSEQAAAYFADGWTDEGDYFTKQSTNGVINGNYYPDDNSTYFLFQFIADTPTEGWDSTMLGYFNTVLHGVVPSYDESVKDLAYHSNYGVFYLVLADSTTAETALATLCATWQYHSEGAFYYANSSDQLGYARGSVYQMAADQYWAVLEFTQTAYESDMEALFEEHLGFVPPFFSGFPTYVWHEGEFVCEYIMQTSQLAAQIAAYQDDIVNYYGFTDLGSSSGSVFVYNGGQSGTYQATIYTYGALLQDGGALIVELYSMYGQYIGFNIYYQAQPVSIALSGEYKTSYTLGEEFSAEGVVVTATMSDTTTVDVTDKVTFSGYDREVEGQQTITVSYGNLTATYTVTVTAIVPVFQGIEVTTMPNKVVYKPGEEFDTTGLVVSALYDIGDPVVLDLSEVEISGFDSETVGEKTITVTYNNAQATFNVVVAEAYSADDFAQLVLAKAAAICTNGGKSSNKAALLSAWTELSQYYSLLDNEEKAKVIAAEGKVDGTTLERAMAFYDYVVNKYKLGNFVENRNVKALVLEQPTQTSNLPIIVIVVSTFVAITAIGVVIALRRRKSLLIK